MTCACTETSSAETGSSHTITLGSTGERAGDAQPLPLPAGELVRVFAHLVGPQAHAREQAGDTLGTLGARSDAIVVQRFADDSARAHPWIERCIRVLENDLQPAPARAHRAAIESCDVVTFQRDRAAGRLDETQDRFSGRRFSAPALADQSQGFARGDVERHAVHGLHGADLAAEQAAAYRVVLDQRVDFEHGPRRDGRLRHG
jgi:hypothetical protein